MRVVWKGNRFSVLVEDGFEIADTPELRGMANAIRFLVRTEEVKS